MKGPTRGRRFATILLLLVLPALALWLLGQVLSDATDADVSRVCGDEGCTTWPDWLALHLDVVWQQATDLFFDEGMQLSSTALDVMRALAWLIPAAVLLLVVRQVRLLFGDREPGPVEVHAVTVTQAAAAEDEESAGSSTPTPVDAESASALLRVSLGNAGVAPQVVTPGGLGTTSVDAFGLIEGLPGPQWVASVAKALRHALLPEVGYTLSASLVQAPSNTWTAAVDLTHKRSGTTVLSRSVSGDSCEAALEAAAVVVHQRLHTLPEVARRTAGQLRWSSSGASGLGVYEQARRRHERAQADESAYSRSGKDLRAALELAEQAVRLEPGNLQARVLLGDCHRDIAQRRQRSPAADRLMAALTGYLAEVDATQVVAVRLLHAWRSHLDAVERPSRPGEARGTGLWLTVVLRSFVASEAPGVAGTQLVDALERHLKRDDPSGGQAVTVALAAFLQDVADESERRGRRDPSDSVSRARLRAASDRLLEAWSRYLAVPGRSAADEPEHYVDALEAFLEAVLLDPGLTETRLRLAGVLAYAHEWAAAWRRDYLPARHDGRSTGRVDLDAEKRRRRAQGARVQTLLDELWRRDQRWWQERRPPPAVVSEADLLDRSSQQLVVALRRTRPYAVAGRWLVLRTRDSVRGAAVPFSRRRQVVKDLTRPLLASVRVHSARLRRRRRAEPEGSMDVLRQDRERARLLGVRLRTPLRAADRELAVQYNLAGAYLQLAEATHPALRERDLAAVSRHFVRAHRGPHRHLSRRALVHVAADPDWDDQWDEPHFSAWWEAMSRERRRSSATSATAGQAWSDVATAADRMSALWADRLACAPKEGESPAERTRTVRRWLEADEAIQTKLAAGLATGASQARSELLAAVADEFTAGKAVPAALPQPANAGDRASFEWAVASLADRRLEAVRRREAVDGALRRGQPLSPPSQARIATDRLQFWEEVRAFARAPASRPAAAALPT